MDRQQIDIYQRIFLFVTKTFEASRAIPNSLETLTIKRQLLRSSSSIGANAQEADGAGSRRDFVHKLRIAKKEAKETLYWFQLLQEVEPRGTYDELINECDQIVRILSTIIIRTKR